MSISTHAALTQVGIDALCQEVARNIQLFEREVRHISQKGKQTQDRDIQKLARAGRREVLAARTRFVACTKHRPRSVKGQHLLRETLEAMQKSIRDKRDSMMLSAYPDSVRT